MKILSPTQFADRQLKNGEEFVLIFDIGHTLTLQERNQLTAQLRAETNRIRIVDEWTDDAGRYYMKVKVIRNLLWGVVIVIALSTVFVVAAGIVLSDVLVGVGEVSEKAVPLTLLGIMGITLIVGYKWMKKRK